MSRHAHFSLPALVLAVFAASSAVAQEFVPVMDEAEFVELVEGRELSLGLLGVTLQVLPDGLIDGRAAGWDLTGTWNWQDGFFCREMDWSGTEIPYNCQLVEVQGSEQIRFTVDQGAGRAATLRIR